MSISVAVMDSNNGRPAAGVLIGLQHEADTPASGGMLNRTNEAGRVQVLDKIAERGRYRLTVDLDEYFAGFGVIPTQSQVELAFRVFHSGWPVEITLAITSSSCGIFVVVPGDDAHETDIDSAV